MRRIYKTYDEWLLKEILKIEKEVFEDPSGEHENPTCLGCERENTIGFCTDCQKNEQSGFTDYCWSCVEFLEFCEHGGEELTEKVCMEGVDVT
jgi:hypothetical protein